ncbi:MAG: hypothetical protein AAF517_23700 [Planctomycetota bacterium]
MSVFRRGQRLGTTQRYKILIVVDDGETLFWHKKNELHVVDEDVARIFVQSFKPELFQVTADGSLQPPEDGVTRPIVRVEMVAV